MSKAHRQKTFTRKPSWRVGALTRLGCLARTLSSEDFFLHAGACLFDSPVMRDMRAFSLLEFIRILEVVLQISARGIFLWGWNAF